MIHMLGDEALLVKESTTENEYGPIMRENDLMIELGEMTRVE